jgi:hypothetical protein
MGLATALGLGLAAVAAEPAGKGKAAGPAGPGSPAKGVAGKTTGPVPGALASTTAPDVAKTAGLPDRPRKTITPPTMTPADLDALVDAFLAKSKVDPATLTTDVEFVRRIYLDITGKLPTPEETRAFVATREKDKRAKLIEYLLNSHDYAVNWARYWRDVIKYHATNQNLGRIGFNELEGWLTKQIARNRPWDEVARELITATGRTDENGATLFALAHEAQAVEIAGEVSRIFLGVQIQCAQCHDHPNDSWKRQQFHEFAAFFAGVRSKQAQPKGAPPVFEVAGQPKVRYTMPDLKDPQKQIPVAPKFFLAGDAKPLPGSLSAEERRALAASYVTGQDNPWFAKAFVNRVWYVLMGDAFYTPVDDLGPERTPKAPEVIDKLADQWQKGGYDVRWLFRTILNSKAYQREVRSTYSASGRTPFACVSPSRLRADQILDSLSQALQLPLNGPAGGGQGKAQGKGQGKGQGKAAAKGTLAAELKNIAGKKAVGRGGSPARAGFNALFGVDPSTPYDDVLGTIPQSLYLMNSPVVNRAVEARPGTVLGEILMATPDNRQALRALYVRVLAREPTAKEVQTCGRYLETVGNRREAFEDILWTLINSTEFITRR